jgi:hypothetical protein
MKNDRSVPAGYKILKFFKNILKSAFAVWPALKVTLTLRTFCLFLPVSTTMTLVKRIYDIIYFNNIELLRLIFGQGKILAYFLIGVIV